MAEFSNGKKVGKGNPPEHSQFKPGHKPPGRPKGSRNKLGEAFLEAMHADFEKHGAKVIQTVRADKPDVYLKVVASILPRELNVNHNVIADLSDDELAAVIDELRAGVGASAGVGSGAEAKVRH